MIEYFFVILCWMPVYHRAVAEMLLEQEFAKIRAGGFPVTVEELGFWNRVPDQSPNAADLYKQAFNSYVEPADDVLRDLPIAGYASKPGLGESFETRGQEWVLSHRSENTRTLELLHQAATLDFCQFEPGAFAMHNMAKASELRQSIYLLTSEAYMGADNGEMSKALSAIHATAQLANHLPARGSVSGLVKVATYAMAIRSLEYLLSRNALSQAQISECVRLVEQMEQADFLHSMLIGDRCESDSLFEAFPEAIQLSLRISEGMANVLADREFVPPSILEECYLIVYSYGTSYGLFQRERFMLLKAHERVIEASAISPGICLKHEGEQCPSK